MKKASPIRGFTLTELLVVIAVISILSTVVLVSLGSSRAKGRDARRVSDVRQIQLALARYYDANDKYPATIGSGSSGVLVSGNFIQTVPVDPSSGAAYSYSASVNSAYSGSDRCSGYHIGADLEGGTSHVALKDDSDTHVSSGGSVAASGETLKAQTVLCSGSAADFHGTDTGKCNASSLGTACYDVRP